MFKRKELAEIPNVKPIAAETKKQRAKEGKQRSKQLRRSAKQSEMNAAQSARSIKKRRAPEKAADCLQYERMYESGICEVEPGLFSMTMRSRMSIFSWHGRRSKKVFLPNTANF